MKLFESKHLIALLGVLALVVSGCASGGSKPKAQQFEAPENVAAEPDKNLFSKALKAQNAGQFESAIKLWQSFLSKHPKSFEGHNNLGLVYYAQDMMSQALSEFETAYRLNRGDPKIRKNLARALRFQAGMFHENREYFKTLEILGRLELIAEPEEKQAILFKQEQVEDQIFLQVIKADNSAAYQDFIDRFPDGLNAVRAREYLEKNPNKKASRTTSKTTSKPKKITSNVKSWISSGQPEESWASAEQPPDYSATRPSAVYTPPADGGAKKLGDFFGADSEGMKKAEEARERAPEEVAPETVIPFEDFEKPQRSTGDSVETMVAVDSKESQRVAGEFNPMGEEPESVTANLDTLPDLKPIPASELPPEESTPEPEDTAAGEIEMQPVEQEAEKTETAATEETVEQVDTEEVKPEESQPETAQAEAAETVETAQPEETTQAEPQPEMVEAVTTGTESEETESERIARIVKEEIAKEESEQSEQVQAEPTQEEVGSEQPLEVASIEPENQAAQQETAPTENAAVEETPPAQEEAPAISPETVSETVAALIPSPPVPAEAAETSVETPAETMDSSGSMVVVQMNEGSTLNVRAEPSSRGEIMGYLENGDMMPYMSQSGDWYQIEIEEGLSGWISKKYSTLREAETVETVASVPTASEPVQEALSSELTPLGEEPKQPVPDNAMVVVTVSEGATLNVRSIPSPSGAIVDMLFRGDKLPLLKEKNGWYQVAFEDETTGWISKKFSIIEGSTLKTSLPAPAKKEEKPKVKKPSNGMVTTVVVIKVPEGSSLNVRSAPSSQGQVMGSLKSGDMRPLLEEEGEWYQVELQDGQSGWVNRKFSGKMDVDSSFLNGP